MKIGAFLQSVGSGLKSNPTQNKQENNTSEVLLADFKAGPQSSVQSVFDKYQYKPTAEDIKQVSAFMNGAKGTEAEKLQTLDIALFKGIEPTRDNLMTMHQAIVHDGEVVGTLVDVEAEPVTGEAAKKIIDALKLPAELKTALKREIDNGATLKEAVVSIARTLNASIDKSSGKTSVLTIDIQSKSLAKIIKAIETLAASKPEILAKLLNGSGVGSSDKTLSTAIFDAGSSAPMTSEVEALSQLIEAGSDKTPGEYDKSDHLEIKQFDDNSGNILVNKQSHSISDQSNTTIEKVSSSQGNEQSTNEVSQSNAASESLEADMTDEALLALMNDMVDKLLESSGVTLNALMETMSLKTYLVETTTEATMHAKSTFEAFRAETASLLKAAVAPQNEAALAGNLSKVIEKLNQIILKSDVTLFTDMFTEKKLLLMASELDKAQEYTRQGELSKAQNIVKSAIGLLEQIKFNPSQRRVQVFAQTKVEQLTQALEKPEKTTIRLDAHIKHQLEQTRDVQGSKMARDILETMRFLGLNHEMEVAESLETTDFETVKDWNQSNVKEILLKLMKEEVKDRPIEGAGQNLMNLSGQQMMNDSGSREQPFHFFNLPIMDGDELGNMKVYMKGASKGHQMDWKNAELYFGVTLKTSGPIGIKVKIQQQKVDLQVMSDDLGAITAPLERVMEELESFGFSKGEVSFSGYSKETGIVIKPQLEASKSAQSFTNDGKGFDFKI